MKLLNHPHTSLVATSWNLGMDKLLHSTFYIIYMPIVGYILGCRSCLFVCTLHHLIIIIMQTYLKTLNLWNACQIYFVECVSKIKHIFSVIHYTIYGAVCFQFTHFPCDDRENIHFILLSSSIGSMNYYPLFRVRSWNNGMSCMSLSIFLMDILIIHGGIKANPF